MAHATHQPPPHTPHSTDVLRGVLSQFPQVEMAVLFGSVARGQAHVHSDLDIAVQAPQLLTAPAKQALIEALATATGRPVDLVDLQAVGEPLLGQILKHGRRLLGSDTAYGRLIYQHVLDQADFMPYRSRIVAERRATWIG